MFSKYVKALIFTSNEHYFDLPVCFWRFTENKKRLKGSHEGARAASKVRRRLFRVAHLAAVLPSHHSCLSETESRSPSPWSAGRLQLPVCPRLFASSFRRSSPKTPLRQKNPPLPSRPREKMVAAVCPRYFCCGIRTELIRQIPVREKKGSSETPVVVASCASLKPSAVLFEIWSRHKQ